MTFETDCTRKQTLVSDEVRDGTQNHLQYKSDVKRPLEYQLMGLIRTGGTVCRWLHTGPTATQKLTAFRTCTSSYSPSACAETASHLPSFDDQENIDREFFTPNKQTTCVCGRSLPGIVGSNPAGRLDVVCCQAEATASGWSLFQRSPTECGVSVTVKPWQWGDPGPLWAVQTLNK